MIFNKVLKIAIKEACKSDVIRGKIGAVAFTNNGHIITKAHNSTFHGSNRFRTIHAEEALLNKIDKINAEKRFDSINILVVRYIPGTKRISLAKPCIFCHYALSDRFYQVFYTTENGEIHEL